jgi:hypothetical protein
MPRPRRTISALQDNFFREFVGLSDEQIEDIRAEKAIAKVLESPTPDEVIVFGAVYLHSAPERYLKLASDLDALRKLPNYLALRQFSAPPQLSDLNDFTLEQQDINDLQHSAPRHCEMQLPGPLMEEFQVSGRSEIDRSLNAEERRDVMLGSEGRSQFVSSW